MVHGRETHGREKLRTDVSYCVIGPTRDDITNKGDKILLVGYNDRCEFFVQHAERATSYTFRPASTINEVRGGTFRSGRRLSGHGY